MFKSIKELFTDNSKFRVKSVKRVIYDTDSKIKVSGFFKVEHNIICDETDEEKLQDIVTKELFSKKDFGYFVSRTRGAKVKVISMGGNNNGFHTVHFELISHFYNSYVAIDDYSAQNKAKDYLAYHTEVPYYLNKMEGCGHEVEIDFKTISNRQVTFFEGEDGYYNND